MPEALPEHRVVRAGRRRRIWTVGYEKRTGPELIGLLHDAGVEHLADIRAQPNSRRADFRAKALASACEAAGIEYGSWPMLGATEAQRKRLKETGDRKKFFTSFRARARRMDEPLDALAAVARKKVIALLCYEREHDDCHRSVIAELLADRLHASVLAIE